MYQPKSQQELLVGLVTAGLGAGIVTSFAVAQGQSPFVGLGITLFAAITALLCDRCFNA